MSLFYSKSFAPEGPNYTHFSSPEFDRLYSEAIITISDSLRFILYRQLDSIAMVQAPIVVLYYDQVVRFVRKEVEGIHSNPMNLLSLKRTKMIFHE